MEGILEVDPWPKEPMYSQKRLVLCAKVRDTKKRTRGYAGFVTRETLVLIKQSSDEEVPVYVGMSTTGPTSTSRGYTLMVRLELEANDLTIIEDRTVQDDD